ncbi:MAG: hypothetical protein UV08_C0011G0003 [Parcubacteria group bacterium GW2011_GWA2_42_18]|nr:MAG: hypothetical protein UV08_C0011G0003 [Parcubacteria group bacterium GW2011_GWA2_42_18]
MTKKLIIILIIISIVAAVLWVGFLIVLGPKTFQPLEEEGDGFREFPSLGGTRQSAPEEETAPVTPSSPSGQTTPETVAPVALPKLWQITRNPTAGLTSLEKERPIIQGESEIQEGTTTAKEKTEEFALVRYAERATGHVFEVFADQTESRRVSNTTIPYVQEALFGNRGESVVLRYVGNDEKSIESFSGTLPKEIEGGDSTLELKGGFLQTNSQALSVSPDTLKMFYMYPFGDGVVGVTSDLSGAKKTQVFDSAFTEWLAQWASTRIIALQTKPSWSIPGYLYALDTQTKNTTRVLGNIQGLTSLMSPNGKLALFSRSTQKGFKLAVYDLEKNQTTDLNAVTLPEKCVWLADSINLYCSVPVSLPTGEYPDDWYKGLTGFTDAVWKVNIKTLVFDLISSPLQEVSADIDGINLTLSPKNDYLFFINKKDSSLWGLKLTD